MMQIKLWGKSISFLQNDIHTFKTPLWLPIFARFTFIILTSQFLLLYIVQHRKHNSVKHLWQSRCTVALNNWVKKALLSDSVNSTTKMNKCQRGLQNIGEKCMIQACKSPTCIEYSWFNTPKSTHVSLGYKSHFLKWATCQGN